MIKLTILFYSFMITMACTQTITLLNNGKAGGSFNARTLMYKEALESKGYTVIYENIGKIAQSVKIFKETKEPTLMVYSTNQSNKRDLHNTSENFILIEYEQPLYICTSKGSQNKSGRITVAHGKGYDPVVLERLLGKDIVLVPYKNSGAILNGMLGGDVDVMVNNQGKSLKYMASGKGSCTVSYELPMMHATVIAKNLDIKKMRSVLKNIVTNDSAFVDYHTSRKLKTSNQTWSEELVIVQRSEKAWK